MRHAAVLLLACWVLQAQSRPEALRRMEEVMGPLPALGRGSPTPIESLLEEDAGSYTRTKITFTPESGRMVFAWLLIPKGPGPFPAVLCLHQTTRIGKDEPIGRGPNANLHYAKELAERGWIALVPDYPSFGDDKTDFKSAVYGATYRSGTMYGIVNHIRGIDLLVNHPRVDRKRIAAIGHSLGGHNSLFVAAFDDRIKAVVSSCGFNSFAKYYGGNLKGWASDRYMPRISDVYQNSPRQMPFDFTDVLAAISPRAVFVNAPLRDANFEVTGVYDVVNAVRNRFAPGRLESLHPNGGHDFPPAVRLRAYEFLEQQTR